MIKENAKLKKHLDREYNHVLVSVNSHESLDRPPKHVQLILTDLETQTGTYVAFSIEEAGEVISALQNAQIAITPAEEDNTAQHDMKTNSRSKQRLERKEDLEKQRKLYYDAKKDTDPEWDTPLQEELDHLTNLQSEGEL